MRLRLLESQEFPFGPGLFETIRMEMGNPVFLKDHWERLSTSCRTLNLPFPFIATHHVILNPGQNADRGNEVKNLLLMRKRYSNDKKMEGRIRLIYKNENEGPMLWVQFLKPKPVPDSWILFPLTINPHPQASHKTTDRRAYEDWHETAVRQGAHDALLMTSNGEILETSRANVFIIKGGELFTPPPDAKILPGILRSRVIRNAQKHKIPVHETHLGKENVERADSVFVTNSIVGILPVIEIAGLWKGLGSDVLVEKLGETSLGNISHDTVKNRPALEK